jgi:uncharacterized membrane protein
MQALYPGETVLRPKKKFTGSSGALRWFWQTLFPRFMVSFLLDFLTVVFIIAGMALLWLNLRSIIGANSS